MHAEPIAIVGMGCRFPGGVDSPAAFWQLLVSATDAITEVPPSRFDIDAFYDERPGIPGKTSSRFGGFLAGIDRFDAGFFGISPREAAVMDPQQRNLLEVAWEALEDAGLSVDALTRHRAGVFVGMMYNDYLHREYRDLEQFDLVMATGGARNSAAARISYALGITGPSLVVDSDRSSSLTALHLACQSLRSGECSVAIAGATNVILGPETTIAFSRARMLAPDGRCKFGDARADGFVRSEGIGALVLKPMHAARRDGDLVYAVLRGTAISHNGNASGDVMRPARAAQQALLRTAWQNAGVSPHQIQYVEAHGTGTTVGDQVEVEALGAALSAGRPSDRRCAIGSVKTNIGHAEGAAGIAGVIKVALALQHGFVPPSLHCATPHPNIPWAKLPVRVQREGGPWPQGAGPRIAGVSAFGLTGELAHAVLEGVDAAPTTPVEPGTSRAHMLPLSAHDREALDQQAAAVRDALAHGELAAPLAHICYSASSRRQHHEHRLALVADSKQGLIERLTAYLDGDEAAAAGASRVRPGERGRLAFVFPGQGSQWVGMGRQLLREEPIFADVMGRCDRAIRAEAGWSLLGTLATEAADPRRQEIDVIQPTLVAMMVSLAALWRELGIEPQVVLGASMGEIAAAQVAGALTIEDALAIACRRTALMKRLRGHGAMALVQLSLEDTEAALGDARDRLSVAASSGPSSTVVSGDPSALQQLLDELTSAGVDCKRINVDVASHSPQMDRLLEELRAALADLEPRLGSIPLYFTVDDAIVLGTQLDARYWARNLREPVLMASSTEHLLGDGYTVFLEVSPHPIVRSQLLESIRHVGAEAAVAATLRRDENERGALLTALGQLHVHGFSADWDKVYAPTERRFTRLPTYRWQRRAYWYDPTGTQQPSSTSSPSRQAGSSPAPAAPARRRLADDLRDTTPGQRAKILTKYLQRAIQRSLKLSADEPDPDIQRPLRDLGLTSLMATELCGELERALGRHCPNTLFFNYPTIEQLVEHLAAAEPGVEDERFAEPVPRERRDATPPPADDAATSEPIALIGMGCRFPGGVYGPDDYWRLLKSGIDAISEVPADRWNLDDYYDPDPEAPGKMYTRWGGFLDSIDRFDAAFFGISPREAESLDPQQRLLLEVTLEALEHAGHAPDPRSATNTGVFVGIMNNNDYASCKGIASDPSRLGAHDSTGHATAAAAGRLSYVLGFQGPSMAIDTACSSSLVAVHLACQALRANECRVAVAGGVNVMLAPEVTISFCKTRMLSPTGRCRTFDAAADGYVRGEGCGMLVLKRLSDAVADRDHVLAILRSSAVNQDGRSSSLTAPNGLAQQALIRQALASAGVAPTEIHYVEAHGTGTALGDPIEVEALGEVLGRGRDPRHPLLLGSVKTNIGHLEAAAGVAGLIKLALALQHEAIPPLLHLEHTNPGISLEASAVAIPTVTTPWPRGASRRVAGISSFGFTGTNAHIVVEEAPVVALTEPKGDPPHHLLTLSAVRPEGLAELAGRYVRSLAKTPANAADLCFTSNAGRAHYAHRAAIHGKSHDELMAKLAAVARGRTSDGVVFSSGFSSEFSAGAAPSSPVVAFLFTGQGAQYPQMGRELAAVHPTFRDALQRCAEIMDAQLERPLRSLLEDGDPATLERTEFAQPALFALEYALFELWRSWGIEPAYVMGHSLGEYTAAHAAGVLSLEDAAQAVVARGRLMQSIPTQGETAAVFASEEDVAPFVAPFADVMAIAAENAPERILIGGEQQRVRAVCDQLAARGIEVVRMNGLVAAHCPLMDPILDAFEDVGAALTYHPPRIPIVSTRTGQLIDHDTIRDPAHWRQHIRSKVEFRAGMRALHEQGCNLFVEIGPRHTLLRLGAMCEPDPELRWLPSLSKEKHDAVQILSSLAELYVSGARVDWDEFHRPYAGRRMPLPTSPFQRERFWPREVSGAPPQNGRAQARPRSASAPLERLLGDRLPSPSTQVQFASRVGAAAIPLLKDHLVFDALAMPAAAHLWRVHAGARRAMKLGEGGELSLQNVVFPAPLVLALGDDERDSHLVLSPRGDGGHDFQIASTEADAPAAGAPSWRVHALGSVHPAAGDRGDERLTDDTRRELVAAAAETLTGEEFYALQARRGYTLGESFRWLEQVWLGRGEALALLQRPPAAASGSPSTLHPGWIDSCLQVATRVPSADPVPEGEGLFVPAAVERFTVRGESGGDVSYCRATLLPQSTPDPRIRRVRLELFTETGEPIAELDQLRLTWVERADLLGSVPQRLDDAFLGIEWRQATLLPSPSPERGRWLIFADGRGVGTALAATLHDRGHTPVLLPARAEDEDFVAQVTALLDAPGPPWQGIVYLWGLDFADADDGRIAEFEAHGCRSLLHLVQVLVGRRGAGAALWVVTRGAQRTGRERHVLWAGPAELWGLGRVVAAEHGALWGGLIDLDPQPTEDEAAELLEELWGGAGESQVAHRMGERWVPRLAPLQSLSKRGPTAFDAQATYLITGAFGALGRAVVAWMVDHGARHLALLSRSGPDTDATAWLAGMERRGARITPVRADASRADELAAAFARIDRDMPPLKGILHAAGVVDDAVLSQLEWESFAAVLAPKTRGSLHLDALTRDRRLDFFVMFSSVAGVLGNPGQASYAAANAFMDALAHHRRGRGLPALSIAWGPWDGDGMSAEVAGALHQRWGLLAIPPSEGVRMLGRLLQQTVAHACAAPVDPAVLAERAVESPHLSVVSELVSDLEPPDRDRPVDDATSGIRELPAEQQQAAVLEHVGDVIKSVAGMAPGETLAVDARFDELGVDSLLSVDVLQALQRSMGMTLPATLLIDCPTVAFLTEYLVHELRGASSSHGEGGD